MDALKEVLQRVTRIESRLCRLGDLLGSDLRSSDKGLRVMSYSDATVSISMPALDVGLSQIARFLTKEGIEGKVALLYYQGKLVARTYPLD